MEEIDCKGFDYLQVDIMFHKTHTRVSGPALLIVIPDNVFIVRVRMLSQVSLDQVTSFLCSKPIRGNMGDLY